ncbi:MAG: hypothetical protein R3324_01005 [Halobacteriales archaeon]|nr:hypothetical protein [Halobacteriales archaeon]
MALAIVTDEQAPSLSVEEVIARVSYLQGLHGSQAASRARIRTILNGGENAIRELLANTLDTIDDLTPIPPLLTSAVTRLGQKIGTAVPDLKTPEYGYKDSDAAKRNAELRQRIVESYDNACRLELQLPQAGRWAAGYGFFVWIVKDALDRDGSRYPYGELRDPFSCYPGQWGVDQQPEELAVLYRIQPDRLARIYPEIESTLRQKYPRVAGGILLTSMVGGPGSWANQSGEGVLVAEYYHPEGTHVVLPEFQMRVSYAPNPIAPRNRFVVGKRFAFDKLTGHYDHAVGLLAMLAKLDILQYIHTEDNVMAETNVFGDSIDGSKYRRGRRAVNRFTQGTRVEKPQSGVDFRHFQMVDRIERRFRIGASYPVTDDGESPMSFVTGRGLANLRGDVDLEIKEYQKVLRYAIEDLDAARLMWDEKRNAGVQRGLVGFREGKAYAEKYEPGRDINGRYVTRRIYGVMAGWDEPQKIVTGLQLLQAGVIDLETMQENLDGLDNQTRVNDRRRRQRAEDAMLAMLEQAVADPSVPPQEKAVAKLALRDIKKNPEKFDEIIDKWFTPDEPEVSEDESGFVEGPPQNPFGDGPPPDVQTVLSRLEQGGDIAGGVQTVGQL